MATEKILNTRIQLKYDSYANWSSKNPVLKSGEVAIAYLATAQTTATPDNGTHPVMFKVGPGNFNDLPWVSALAADVHSWAKKSEADFKTWVKGVIEVSDIDAYSKAQIDKMFSDNAAADQAHADAVAATAKSEAIAAAASDAAAKVKELAEGAVADNTADIAAIKDGSTGILAEAKAYADQAEADAVASAKDYTDAREVEIKKYADQAEADALSEAKAYTDAREIEIKKYADQAEADALSAAKAYTDEREVAITSAYQSYADQAEADALSAAKAYADDLKDAILGEGIKDTFDTLKEIQDWIEGDGVNATELTGAIAAEAKAREDADKAINDRIDALNITDGKVANAAMADKANSLTDAAKEEVKGVKVDNATNADVADSLTDNAKEEVKGVKVDNAAHADVADKANGLTDAGVAAVKAVKVDNAAHADDADKLGGVAAADYALKTDAQGYANTAETNAKNYADSLAGNYATAAQGAKADSALQSIEAGLGLKVSAKADNKQTIDIDDSVVFVFNCGSASELVD